MKWECGDEVTNYKPAVILKRIQGRWARVLAKRLIKEVEK
jgi:hypothetical protein